MATAYLRARHLPAYRCVIGSIDGGPLKSDPGMTYLSERVADFENTEIDTIIVPGSQNMAPALSDRRLIAWIAKHGPKARRLCSVCTGAFVLAEAGILNGKRAVTHWAGCNALENYPGIKVVPDAIFIREDDVWTSAGVTAGIDLALALVQDDQGREAAMHVAREHVVFLKRPGGQSQFSVMLQAQVSDEETFAELHRWIMERLADPRLGVETLAEKAGMSPRNFARVYKTKTGRTPAKAIEFFRLETARRLLEESDQRIDIIARRTGFGDEERMRSTFQRHLNVSPRDYRDRFSH